MLLPPIRNGRFWLLANFLNEFYNIYSSCAQIYNYFSFISSETYLTLIVSSKKVIEITNKKMILQDSSFNELS